MEKLNYIIEDSTIAELLGIQNFSTDEAAILELVKNAYDAKALKVTLKFSDNQLEIIDDGDGMDSDDIKKHWMHIGKSDKSYEIIDENNNKRIQAGSKGVGRFALSRLGCQVNLATKKDKCMGVIWSTDWNGSTLEIDEKNKNKGTKIIINGLREKWSKKRIENLCKYLEKTYNDSAMEIEIVSGEYDVIVPLHFPKAEPGINCRSNVVLIYNKGILSTIVKSDEFLDEANIYCLETNLHEYLATTDMFNELQGTDLAELIGEDLKVKLEKLGKFSADLFFNMTVTNNDKQKFLYKYLNTPKSVESGIILYRNAFSISSYEGDKDWLELGKRSRKSPAAATHPTGSWRVRENQMSGSVIIDKKENAVLQDLMNRQGLDENVYYQLFVEIVLTGIKEFERYRQGIIRKINKKNQIEIEKIKPVSDMVMKNPTSVNKLTEDEAKQLVDEIKIYKKEGNQYKKEKDDVEARYKYDIRILNVLATTGLKASSIAHELKNDRNTLYENYDNIVSALKEYDMWDKLNLPENIKKSYKNVPYLLKSSNIVGKKLVSFMDTMLSEIEKKQFEAIWQSVADILMKIKNVWERDYAWINIIIDMEEDITYKISEDMIQVILDNLILNSVQQNENTQHMTIDIKVSQCNGLLKFVYSDNGRGLDKKYATDPRKILEVHETTRINGHGLGMWIVNNTSIMSGGEIQTINGMEGFCIEFTIGDKN
jgi:Histidine kinase-, DNA gyrase B-, and HSP90-like ATPase.